MTVAVERRAHRGGAHAGIQGRSQGGGWLCFLLLAVLAPSSGGLPGVSAANGTYSPPELEDGYASATSFNAGGLGFLYDAAEKFVKMIQKGDPLPPGMVQYRECRLWLEDATPSRLASYYAGLLGALVAGLIVILVVPVVGAVRLCCCFCSSATPAKGKRIKRNNLLYLSLLTIFSVVILLGAAFSFFSNEHLDRGIRRLPTATREWRDDMRLFIRNTKTEVNTLLDTNYKELSSSLSAVLSDGRDKTNEKLSEMAQTLPLDHLTGLAQGLRTVRLDLESVENASTEALRLSSSIFTDVKSVGTALENMVNQCRPMSLCPDGLEDLSSQLNNIPEITNLPAVESSLEFISSYVTSDFEDQLIKGRKMVDEIQTDIQRQLQDIIDTTNGRISDTGDTLLSKANEVTNATGAPIDEFLNSIDGPLDDADRYIAEYNKYRYYVGVAISLIMLLVVAFIGVGILCGACSRRPSYGSLAIASLLIYVTTSVLMLVTMALFLVGAIGETAVCQTLRQPERSQIFGLIDQVVDLDSLLSEGGGNQSRRCDPGHEQSRNRTLSSFISACHRNTGMYEALKLDSVVNIDEVLTYAGNFTFDDFIDQINGSVTGLTSTIIIPPKVDEDLNALENSPLTTINFTLFENEAALAKATLDSLKVADWATQLRDFGQSLSINVSEQVDALNRIDQSVTELQVHIQTLNSSVAALRHDMALNHSSFKDAVLFYHSEMRRAGPYIQSEAPYFVQLANSTAQKFTGNIKEYLNYVVTYTKTEAIRCGPMSRVYNATLIATCDEVLRPLNGFWASLGWSLVIFIPTLIVAAVIS